jgi:hypothetical protein
MNYNDGYGREFPTQRLAWWSERVELAGGVNAVDRDDLTVYEEMLDFLRDFIQYKVLETLSDLTPVPYDIKEATLEVTPAMRKMMNDTGWYE